MRWRPLVSGISFMSRRKVRGFLMSVTSGSKVQTFTRISSAPLDSKSKIRESTKVQLRYRASSPRLKSNRRPHQALFVVSVPSMQLKSKVESESAKDVSEKPPSALSSYSKTVAPSCSGNTLSAKCLSGKARYTAITAAAIATIMI